MRIAVLSDVHGNLMALEQAVGAIRAWSPDLVWFLGDAVLGLACADCHVANSGGYIRSDLLSPALGNLSHFPVYRLKWQGLGTPHRRFGGCNKQVRAKPLKPQSDSYKALELYQAYMNTGVPLKVPSQRQ